MKENVGMEWMDRRSEIKGRKEGRKEGRKAPLSPSLYLSAFDVTRDAAATAARALFSLLLEKSHLLQRTNDRRRDGARALRA